jgi:alcohol dehydrogenase YqhD (iron-dependent ADH family)
MENFTMYNPVKVHFGAGVLDHLGATVLAVGRKVLFLSGKGSIRRNGLYEKVMTELENAGCEVFEYQGIKSNPVIEDVDKAASIGRENLVDVVLAVGGGSVIDSAKIVAAAIPVDAPAWDLVSRKIKPVSALPVITVLTLAATGTEMNPFAVVQNEALGIKTSFTSPFSFPVHSFLDPSLTTTVNAEYTGYGIADLMAHAMEAWFGKGDSPLADRVVTGILLEAMEAGPLLMKKPDNYDLRARIMYASTLALNGTCMHGRAYGDWGVHSAGHVLSLLYDIPHGASLTIVYPAWLKLIRVRDHERVGKLLKHLFHTDDINEGILMLEHFFSGIQCPIRLGEVQLTSGDVPKIMAQMVKNQVSGMYHPLSLEDYARLLEYML